LITILRTHPSGTKYTASVVYDTNQEDQSPNDLTKGQYAYKKLSISIGDDVATDYGTGIIEVYNLNTDDPNDVNSHPTDLIRISSHDISASTALKNISLPTGLNLSRFTIGNASFIELENEFAETITRGDLTLNPDEVFFKFEGELGSNINTDAGEGFGTHPPGSKFTGYLIYNINQVDQYLPTQEEIDLGLWEPNNNSKYSYKELSVTIGNDTATDYGPGYIHVNYQNLNDQDSLEYYPQDRISIYSSDLVGSLGGLTLDDNGIYLSLEDSTGSVFNDNSLPSELDITKFTSGYLKLESYVDHSNPSSDPSLQININSDIKINSDNTIEVELMAFLGSLSVMAMVVF